MGQPGNVPRNALTVNPIIQSANPNPNPNHMYQVSNTVNNECHNFVSALMITLGDLKGKMRLPLPDSFHSHSLTHSLTDSLTDSLTRSLTHSLAHLLTHFPAHPLTRSLTHPLAHSLAHSLTHPLTHPPTWGVGMTTCPKLNCTESD